MRITTLIENRVSKLNLVAEHGLSFLIESSDAKLLFDTGQTNNFALNATQLGHDISKIGSLVISHGHYDHTGGIEYFMEQNKTAAIFVKKGAFTPRFHNNTYVGTSGHIKPQNPRFNFVDIVIEIANDIFVMPHITNSFSDDNHKNNFVIEEKGELIPDNFSDELFLVLRKNNALTVLSSCSHNGISNMVETARQYFNLPVKRVIGGFHLKHAETHVAHQIADYFNTIKLKQIHTCHCTGIEKYIEIREKFKGNTRYLETGDVIEL